MIGRHVLALKHSQLFLFILYFFPGVSKTSETREEGAPSGESVIHHGAGEGAQ